MAIGHHSIIIFKRGRKNGCQSKAIGWAAIVMTVPSSYTLRHHSFLVPYKIISSHFAQNVSHRTPVYFSTYKKRPLQIYG